MRIYSDPHRPLYRRICTRRKHYIKRDGYNLCQFMRWLHHIDRRWRHPNHYQKLLHDWAMSYRTCAGDEIRRFEKLYHAIQRREYAMDDDMGGHERNERGHVALIGCDGDYWVTKNQLVKQLRLK